MADGYNEEFSPVVKEKTDTPDKVRTDPKASSILWAGLMKAVMEFKVQTGLDVSSVEFEYVEGFNNRDAIQCHVQVLPIRRQDA